MGETGGFIHHMTDKQFNLHMAKLEEIRTGIIDVENEMSSKRTPSVNEMFQLNNMIAKLAMSVVNNTNEMTGASVEIRQKTNDRCFDFAESVIRNAIAYYHGGALLV